jgi:hypothetical protein
VRVTGLLPASPIRGKQVAVNNTKERSAS